MRTALTDEQQEIAAVVRDLMSSTFEPARWVEARDKREALSASWRSLTEIGAQGIAVSEEEGGAGGSLIDAAIVAMEAGRALYPARLRNAIVAGFALSGHNAEVAARVATGEITAAVVPQSGASGSIELVSDGGDSRIRGSLELVPSGADADVFVVMVNDLLFVVPRASVTVTPRISWNHDDADLNFDVIVDVDSAARVDSVSVVNLDRVLRCAEMVGGMLSVLERTTAYVIERHQFGRPIGSFQAVQHMLADVKISADAARLNMFYAAWRLQEGLDATSETLAALMLAGPGYTAATLTAHQVHGGMGYSRENDLHLWSERAKALEVTTAVPDVLAEQLGTHLSSVSALPQIVP